MADGKYDSAEYPAVLDAVPETVWTLGSDRTIVSYTSAAVPEAEEPVASAAEEPAEPESETSTVPAADGGVELQNTEQMKETLAQMQKSLAELQKQIENMQKALAGMQ